MTDFDTALNMLDSMGVLRFVDALAAAQPLTVLVRPRDAERLAASLPHAALLSLEPGAPVPATGPLLDCRPLTPATPASLLADDRIVPTLLEDGLAACLTGAAGLQPARPFGPRYYLLSTPRSGSTFLCDLLTRTGRLGTPTEHLKARLRDTMLAADVGLLSIIERLHAHSATPNGAFGMKIIINDLFDFFPAFGAELLAELAQHPVFVLVRGDKAAQALSNVRSNRLALYHVSDDTEGEARRQLAAFEASCEEMFEKERWLLRQEADLLDLLGRHGILPKLLSYETCIQSRQGAETMVREVAASLGLEAPLTTWPKLVRIGGLAPGADLARYQAMRAGARLFSTRSEPWLGTVLGRGWKTPERWGVRSDGLEVEIRPPAGLHPRAIELLITFEGPTRPETLQLGETRLATQAAGHAWRWVAPLEGGTIPIRLSNGAISLEEIVLFDTTPEWHQGEAKLLPR